MTISAELAARLTVARTVSQDFHRATMDLKSGTDWLEYAHRINTALAGLVSALDDALAVSSAVLPGNTAVITSRDLMTILGALADAAQYRAERQDYMLTTRYRALLRALGDDR
jgi:hypothetical protein